MDLFRKTHIPKETIMPAGNTNTGLLKLLALVFMIVDHAGAAFFPNVIELRFIGRLAFPIYIWCAVVGCCYTRSFEKYMLRLLIVGVIAQPCYMLGLSHTWYQLNVFFTLLLGVMGVCGIRLKRGFSHIWAPVAVLLIAAIANPDYGWRGVLLILLVYLCRGSRAAVGAVYLAFCLFWGQGSFTLTTLFGIPLSRLLANLPAGIRGLLQSFLKMQGCAVLALPLILIPTGVKWRMPKWMTYAAYPAHLLIIGLIRLITKA